MQDTSTFQCDVFQMNCFYEVIELHVVPYSYKLVRKRISFRKFLKTRYMYTISFTSSCFTHVTVYAHLKITKAIYILADIGQMRLKSQLILLIFSMVQDIMLNCLLLFLFCFVLFCINSLFNMNSVSKFKKPFKQFVYWPKSLVAYNIILCIVWKNNKQTKTELPDSLFVSSSGWGILKWKIKWG